MAFFKGANGELSSKRLAGFLGLLGLIFIGVFAVTRDATQASNVMWPIAGVVGTCLGVTVIEKKREK